MEHSYNACLAILGLALREIRRAISAREPDDYASLCAAAVDILAPIPIALLVWTSEVEELLYDDMKTRAARANRAGLLDHWMACAKREVAGEAAVEGEILRQGRKGAGFSAVQYLMLLDDMAEKMEESKGDPGVLYAFSDAFHDLPDALRHEWTEAHEERVYENLMRRAAIQGIRGQIEHWMREIGMRR